MTTRDQEKDDEAARRQGERRDTTDGEYQGPERRKGDRRVTDRRKEPRS